MMLKGKRVRYYLLFFSVLVFISGCRNLTPRQVHLSFQGDPSTSVTVTWITWGKEDTETHAVKCGTSPGGHTEEAFGSSHKIPNEPIGYVHEVQLTDLVPNTRYYYICGDKDGGWSPEFTFKTAPVEAQDCTFVVIGDMGTTPAANKNLEQMISENAAFVLHVGDLSYANGIGVIWDIWFNQIAPLAANVPYMPSIGNHEVESDLGLSSYLGRFALPNSERWYSFDWGNIHVVSLDTESPYTPESAQLVWLEKDLADACGNPDIDWIVVFFHKPPYSSSPIHGSNLSVRSTICPILEGYGVDVVFNGHDHTYQRSHPIKDGALDPQGTVYVVTGGGGYSLYAVGNDYWSARSESIYHHVRVDITAEGKLRLKAVSRDGGVFDEFEISKTGG